MIAIIDYGLGNLASVKKAFKNLGIESEITQDHSLISESNAIVLPGVGSFRQGMQNLNERGLDSLLTREVIEKKKPFLGICLGMQLIFTKGNEPVECTGLGWIEGEVIKLEDNKQKIPHMGWNSLEIVCKNELIKDEAKGDVYFIHSYHVKPKNKSLITALTHYGESIVASIQEQNIFATQFHPEKSQKSGLSILKFFSNYVKG